MTAHAAGILLTHGNRALFLKRAPTAKDHAGEWCCPGGSLENGETPEQAARRETQEETGLTGLIAGDLNQIDEGDGFVTFRQMVDDEPEPIADDEHTEAMWADMSDPPQPLHPGVAATLAKLQGAAADADKTGFEENAGKLKALAALNGDPSKHGVAASVEATLDRREYDSNNWFEVLDNPLSTVGVYPYSEASVVKGGDRNKMVNVFRPPEELGDPETVKSFRLMPWTDDHPDALFGDKAQGLASTEEKGVRGVIGEQVYYKDGTLYGNLKVFSEDLARKIAAGKRELSCGYSCTFVPCVGTYSGTPYQYVQKNMRGNHVSSVRAGRMGPGVRVLDAAEPYALTFALDLKEPAVADKRKDEMEDCLDADTQAFIADSFNSLVGELEKKGYSKEYATKVAGKVAAEKGMTGHDSTPTGDTKVADKTEAEIKKEQEAKDRKAARDAKRGSLDAMRAKDSMSAEEEEATDAAEEACDAEEEKDDEKDESKEAKDRGRARDRRAGARDGRKGARDRSARDAARDAKGKGMDAAEVTALVNKAIAGVKVPSAEDIVAQVRPAIRKEEAAKASLYGRVSPIIGAFDHAEMTHVEMATYSLDKLGAPKGAADPVGALDFYLAGRAQVVTPASHALDAAPDEGSFMHKYLNA